MYQPSTIPNGAVKKIEDLPFGVTSLRFNDFGTHLAAGTIDGDIYILESRSMCVVRNWRGHTWPILHISWTHCGRFLLTATSTEAKYWTAEDCRPIITVRSRSTLVFAYVNPKDPNQLMCVDEGDTTISLVDVMGHSITSIPHGEAARILAFCGTYDQEGHYVITGGVSGKLVIYDVRKKEVAGTKKIATRGKIIAIRHHWRGHKIVVVSAKAIFVYSMETLLAEGERVTAEFKCTHGDLPWSCAALSPGGNVVCGTTQWRTTIFIWNSVNERRIDTELDGTGDIHAVDWHPLEAKIVFRGGSQRVAYFADYIDETAPPDGLKKFRTGNVKYIEKEWEHDEYDLYPEDEEEEDGPNEPAPPSFLPANYPGSVDGVLPHSIRWDRKYLYRIRPKHSKYETKRRDRIFRRRVALARSLSLSSKFVMPLIKEELMVKEEPMIIEEPTIQEEPVIKEEPRMKEEPMSP
uniref:WD_REPEATS_REGION domain-containing protein n=1 Tax=Steinernema glaseri TaxID=37863 RepID=A0A1I8AFA7_9BILA